MSSRPEDLNPEEVIKGAEEAVSPVSKRNTELKVELKREIALELLEFVSVDQLRERGISKAFGTPDTSSITHPENIRSILGNKLIAVLGGDDYYSARRIKSTTPVSIVINTGEITFINDFLFNSLKPEHETDYGDDKELEAWWRNISLGWSQSTMAVLVGLNLAWIKAGGIPHPDFERFYEGLPPASNP